MSPKGFTAPVAADELDELVRALSHGTRRHILRICADKSVSAGDIAAEIDLALASVSEHLKVLRKTELVQLQRTGTKWMYRADAIRVDRVLSDLTNALPTKRKSQ